MLESGYDVTRAKRLLDAGGTPVRSKKTPVKLPAALRETTPDEIKEALRKLFDALVKVDPKRCKVYDLAASVRVCEDSEAVRFTLLETNGPVLRLFVQCGMLESTNPHLLFYYGLRGDLLVYEGAEEWDALETLVRSALEASSHPS